MLIAAFDMGTRNFAFCVEQVTLPLPTPTPESFDVHGLPTEAYAPFLDHVYASGTLVECQCIDLLALCAQQGQNNLYLGLNTVLDQFRRLWDHVDVILVEQQMAYGKNKSNIQALRLAQHCLTYFYTVYGPFKVIQEMSSTLKTRMLGCPHQQRKQHALRKRFAVDRVERILRDRTDTLADHWAQLPKRDDVSDCILMIQVYKIQLVRRATKNPRLRK